MMATENDASAGIDATDSDHADEDLIVPDAPLGPQRSILAVSDPVWNNAEHTMMTAMVQFAEFDSPVPFATTANENTEWGQAVWVGALAGDYGEITEFVPKPEPVPVSISDRQFFQALAVRGLITQDEALAAVKTGDVPAGIKAFIDAMPAAQRFSATMLLSGATTFERAHPITEAFGNANGMSSDDIDDLWRFAAIL